MGEPGGRLGPGQKKDNFFLPASGYYHYLWQRGVGGCDAKNSPRAARSGGAALPGCVQALRLGCEGVHATKLLGAQGFPDYMQGCVAPRLVPKSCVRLGLLSSTGPQSTYRALQSPDYRAITLSCPPKRGVRAVAWPLHFSGPCCLDSSLLYGTRSCGAWVASCLCGWPFDPGLHSGALVLAPLARLQHS